MTDISPPYEYGDVEGSGDRSPRPSFKYSLCFNEGKISSPISGYNGYICINSTTKVLLV